MRAGLLTLAAASYVTTGRSMSRLGPDRREQVLRRVAALSPDAGAAVEAMKAIVLLANGAETYAPELLSHAGKQATARPDAALNIVSSAESRSVVTADAVIVGSGAGGAMVARTLARAGLTVVVLEEGRRWTVEEFRTTHPDRPLCRAVPRRRGHRRAGTPIGGVAHRPGGRRHHGGELRHLLPPAAGRAAALARRVRARSGRPRPARRAPRRRRRHAAGRAGAAGDHGPQRAAAAGRGRRAGLAGGAHSAQRAGL